MSLFIHTTDPFIGQLLLCNVGTLIFFSIVMVPGRMSIHVIKYLISLIFYIK